MTKLHYDGPIVLAVLDGVGLRASRSGNAVVQARTEFLDNALAKYLNIPLRLLAKLLVLCLVKWATPKLVITLLVLAKLSNKVLLASKPPSKLVQFGTRKLGEAQLIFEKRAPESNQLCILRHLL